MDLANASICLLYRYFICSSSVVLYFSLRFRYLFSFRVSFILLQVAVISVAKIWFLFIMTIHHKMVNTQPRILSLWVCHRVISVPLPHHRIEVQFRPPHCGLRNGNQLGHFRLNSYPFGIQPVGQHHRCRHFF